MEPSLDVLVVLLVAGEGFEDGPRHARAHELLQTQPGAALSLAFRRAGGSGRQQACVVGTK